MEVLNGMEIDVGLFGNFPEQHKYRKSKRNWKTGCYMAMSS